MLSLRGVRSGLRAVHNGKGRPVLSSPVSRSYSQLLAHGKFNGRLPLKSHVRSPQLPLASSLLHSYRHASTSSVSTASPSGVTPPASDAATSSSEWEALIQEVSDTHALQVEPHIGWLKELGLDYGWGPTAVMETVLEHIHLYSGLPWWASILSATFLVRILLIRSFVTSADHSARMAMVSTSLKPIQAKMREAQMAGDSQGVSEATRELKATYNVAGVKVSKMFTPIILQAALGFGMFRLVAGMSRLPVPGLESGGALWFKDLTMADPTYTLPILSGVIMWYALKRGGEMGQTNVNPQTWKMLSYILPGITTIIFLNFPAGMQFLACVTASWSSVQGAMLRSPGFRRWCGIAPLPPRKPAGATDTPYQGTVTAYRTPDEIAKSNSLGEKFRKARVSMSTYVKSNTKPKQQKRLSARELEKAQQYEKERRAELDAARDRYLNEQKKK